MSEQKEFTIGVLDDDRSVYLNWRNETYVSKVKSKVIWFKYPSDCWAHLNEIDILIVDCCLFDEDDNQVNIFYSNNENEESFLMKLRNLFKGPLVFSSLTTVDPKFKNEFCKILHDKKQISIQELLKKSGL